ncbi:MAG: hypothetical protein AAGF94_00840 [Pseudomonadota bacterium]
MKLAVTVTAMLGTAAGGIGLLLPDASAPHRIGHVVFAQGAFSNASDMVSTYAAMEPMKEDALRNWAAGLPYREGGVHIIVVYDQGNPVPDPSGAESLAQADWIASSGQAQWRILRQGASVVSFYASGGS